MSYLDVHYCSSALVALIAFHLNYRDIRFCLPWLFLLLPCRQVLMLVSSFKGIYKFFGLDFKSLKVLLKTSNSAQQIFYLARAPNPSHAQSKLSANAFQVRLPSLIVLLSVVLICATPLLPNKRNSHPDDT